MSNNRLQVYVVLKVPSWGLPSLTLIDRKLIIIIIIITCPYKNISCICKIKVGYFYHKNTCLNKLEIHPYLWNVAYFKFDEIVTSTCMINCFQVEIYL